MGLKSQAAGFRRSLVQDPLSSLEDYYSGRNLSREELSELREEIEKRIREAGGNLDRKLIDMQTLFEVGKELNSSFDRDRLLDILLLTLMGQYRLSEAAVYLLSGGRPLLSGQKGFEKPAEFPHSPDTIAFLSRQDFLTAESAPPEYADLSGFLMQSGASGIAALTNKDKPVGFLVLGKKPNGEAWVDDERNFIATLASLSGIALDNARLYEELKEAYQRLDRKVGEQSALYDISALINTSNDFQTVLSLLMETVSTGFGVKSGFLFTVRSSVASEKSAGDATYTVRASVGLGDRVSGRAITLFPDERKCLTENRTSVLSGSDRTRDFCPAVEHYLFVPLVGVDTRIGGLVITELERDILHPKNSDLVHLFSIIASLSGPPLALTQYLQEQKDRVLDPLSPILELMESEIRKAAEYGVEVAFVMLSLKNLKKYVETYGPEEASARLDRLSRTLASRVPPQSVAIRYTLNRFLFIVPGMVETDADDLKEVLQRCALEEFKSDRQIDIGADAQSAHYPSSGDQPLSLLIRIE